MFPNFADLAKTQEKISQQFDEIISLLKIIAANTTPQEKADDHEH